MSGAHNTLFLRLAGPMQSWGTSSRFQLRRTDAYPSKSGVFGLILCAMGIRRADSREALERMAGLTMGVRIDRAGSLAWDYHTAGAKIGIRSADGKIKKTASTGEFETLLSRRQYLWDASFLVALQGEPALIETCASALNDPVWPVFLGRKCCIPAEPVLVGTGWHEGVNAALASIPWQPRIPAIDRVDRSPSITLESYIEHPAGSPEPDGAVLVYDVPRAFGFNNQGPRWIVPGRVSVPVGEPTHKGGTRAGWIDPYGPEWPELRLARLTRDHGLCVFCKSPAVEVHHLDYGDVRPDTLRSLCKLCHDACTILEYGHDMRRRRIDPADPERRPELLTQINRLLTERRANRRRELLEAGRAAVGFFDDAPGSRAVE